MASVVSRTEGLREEPSFNLSIQGLGQGWWPLVSTALLQRRHGWWYHHRSQILHSLLNIAPAKQKHSSQIIRSPTENTRHHCWLTTHAPECKCGHIPTRLLEPQYRADLEMQNWTDPTVCGLYLTFSSCLCLEQEAPVSRPAQPSTGTRGRAAQETGSGEQRQHFQENLPTHIPENTNLLTVETVLRSRLIVTMCSFEENIRTEHFSYWLRFFTCSCFVVSIVQNNL